MRLIHSTVGVAAVAAVLGGVEHASAQAVAGTVTEAGSGRPVVGAMVRLLVGERPAATRFLTAADGAYRLGVPGPGTYHLLVERIGFAATRAGPVEVGAGATVVFDVSVAADPVRLEGLSVEAGRGQRCRLDDGGGETQVVWDEARKALSAASWTEGEAGLSFQIASRDRRLDPDARTVLDERRRLRRAVGGNSVRALPPEELARDGYVREDDDGMVSYYGPDGDVLLSDAFLETHCFTLRPGPPGEEHLLGLAFEPVRGRRVSDVEGVVWMDAASARLDRVEYAYTGLRYDEAEGVAGGEVRFLELPDGRWVVRDWFIRMPALELQRQPSGVDNRIVVASVHEVGASVLSVSGPDGMEWRSDVPVGRVRGIVFDSVFSRPLAGAEVRLAGRGWRALAAKDGSWALEDVPPGRYRIGFDHPRLDSLGVEPAWWEVEVLAGEEVERDLALPPLERLQALACGEVIGGVVVGVVRDDTGRPLAGAEVRVVEGAPDGVSVPVATTNAEGEYRLCGLPAAVEVRVEASLGPDRARGERIRTADGVASRVDVRLARLLAAPPIYEANPAARPVLRGTAVDAASGAVVEGADVSLVDEEGAVVDAGVSDGEGRFVVRADVAGRYTLRVSHLAYRTADSRPLDLWPGTARVEVELQRGAVELGAVVVEVEATSAILDRAGFYERMDRGMGRFFDRAELEAMNLLRASDLANRVPALVPAPMPSSASLDTTRRYYRFRARQGTGDCLPAVFLDGAVARSGGASIAAGAPSLDDIVRPQEIEGIELYTSVSETPSLFDATGGACGAIVVWTR